MRLFIAIELPEEVKAGVFHSFEKLKENGLVSGNFVEKDNLHLTLKFLGEIDEEQLKEIIKEISEIKFKSFEGEIGGIGFFPNENHIKVIWIEFRSKEIFELQKIVEEKLKGMKIKEDEKEFTSHITIARVKSIKNKDVFMEKLKKIHLKKSKFRINKFSLIKSELMREGAKYKTIKEFKLE